MPEVSVSIAQVAEGELADPRAAIRWVRRLGVRWIQLDAARRGIRPRELDRSGRRDLAAFLRREELLCTGLDLWIPEEHFTDPQHVDRAVMAVDAACAMVAEIDAVARLVCVRLPEDVGSDVTAQLQASGEHHGARVADHRAGSALPFVGIDPASEYIAGRDPAAAVAEADGRLVTARLSDLSAIGRCVPGSAGGHLDLTLYAANLATANYQLPVVLDLRGLPEVEEAARHALEHWNNATAFPV